MDTVQVKECVITTLTRRGKGQEGSPIRVITEVWDAETGDKIAENDPMFQFNLATQTCTSKHLKELC